MVFSAATVGDRHRAGAAIGIDSARRWGSILAGGSLVLFGPTRRSPPGQGLVKAGTGLVAQTPLRTKTSAPSAGHGVSVAHSVRILRSGGDSYRYWRDFRNPPRIMDHLESVTVHDDGSSHWVAKGPRGTKAEWDAEIVEDRPNERIAWRSVLGAEIPNRGSVRFEQGPLERGTEATVTLVYYPPTEAVGTAIAKMFGEDSDQQVREDLRRFKAVIEAGETPTTDDQSSG